MIPGPIASRLGPWSWTGFTRQSWWRGKELRVLCALDPGLWVSRRPTVFSLRVAREHTMAVQSQKIGWRITPLW
jgi:hypothetical protein